MLTFTTHDERHYNAIGAYGTHYTITEDHDGEPILYYVEDTNTEHTTFTDAVAYCEAMEATEASAHKCHTLGVRVFDGGFCDEADIRYTAIDEIAFVYCPDTKSAEQFIQFTECCVDSYALSHATQYYGISNTMRHLFKYNAHSDSFERMDDNLCAVISQLIK